MSSLQLCKHTVSFIIIHYLKFYECMMYISAAGEIALLERRIPHFYYFISDSDESHVLLL